MRLLIRTLLVLAALAYGAMHGAAMQSEAQMIPHATQADADCPHPGKTDRTPHCAACLTLPADLRITDAGTPPRAAEAPTVTVAFSSWPAAPLDPPPRV